MFIFSSPTTPSSAWSSGTDDFGPNKSFSFSEVWVRSNDLQNLSTNHNNNVLPEDKSFISPPCTDSMSAGLHPTSQAQSKVLQNLIQDLQRTDLSAFDNINQYHLPSHRAPASSTPINSHTSHSHVPTDMQQRARKSLVFGREDNLSGFEVFTEFKVEVKVTGKDGEYPGVGVNTSCGPVSKQTFSRI
jgi:hypothetical protein